jgi:hypothetical protein
MGNVFMVGLLFIYGWRESRRGEEKDSPIILKLVYFINLFLYSSLISLCPKQTL